MRVARFRIVATLPALAAIPALVAIPALAAIAALAASTASAADGAGARHRFAPGPSHGGHYWTAERIRNAPARALAISRRGPGASHLRPAPGPATRVPGLAPRAAATMSAAFPVPNPPAAPFSTHGKLLGRIDGFPYSCSATSINTPSRSVVLTAAHCLRDPGRFGQWARNVVFIPAFDRGVRPFGTFQATWGRVLRGYAAFNPKFDVGTFVVHANSRGRLGDVVGARGWATGLARDQYWSIFGYPANIADASRMQECDSGWYGNDLSTRGWPGPSPLRVDCNMSHGASGGGWVTADGFLNGVVNYGYTGQPDRVYGTYFGLAVRQLINRMP